jgi:hypothetical protein
MTIKRRARLLAARGLVHPDPRRFFSLTDAGRQALGADMPPRQPWLRRDAVAASLAKDVVARHDRPPDDRTAAFRSMVASMGAQAGVAATRLRKRERQPFSAFGDLDMAG